MAKSMLRQFTQVSGSLAGSVEMGGGYDDTLTLGVSGTAESGANLQEDLNYIRSQIKNIIVRDNWFDLPRDITTLISGTATDEELATAEAIVEYVATVSGDITSSDTFAGLEDTPSGYSEDEVIYYTSSGTSSSANFTFDPDTNDFAVGASGTARLVIDSDSESTLYGDDDTFIAVSGTGASFSEGGNLEFSITSDGVALAGGARVDDILNTADGDSIDASSTDAQLATAKLIYDFITTTSGDLDKEHNELDGLQGGDSLNRWHLDGNTYSGISSDGSTMTISQDLNVTGDTFLDTTLEVGGNAYFGANVTVTGTFGFDGAGTDTTVTGIVTSISEPGSDNLLATEQAIVEWVDAVSGTLDREHNELAGLQGGTAGQYYHMTANTFSGISSDGTTMTITDALNVDGNATFDSNVEIAGNTYLGGNLTVTGTLGFDGGGTDTTVTGIVTSITEPGSDDLLVTEQGIVEYVDSVSGTLQDDILWETVDAPEDRLQPKSDYWNHLLYHPGNATIGGDLTVTGTLFYAQTETVQVEDNVMELNYGEPGSGVTKGTAGIAIDRGAFPYYLFIFDEPTDTFRVGVSGVQDPHNVRPLQPVATREDDPLDHRVTWWDDDYNTLRTQGDTYITIASGTDTINFAVNNSVEFSVVASGIDVANSTAVINEFLNTAEADAIDANSTDAQLATAKLIYDFVTTTSGDLDREHNELAGLQGGDALNRWHLDGNTFSGISSDGSTMTISQDLNVTGDTFIDNTLEVAGNTYFGANVTVTGTFGFDTETTVTGIKTVMTPTGDDDTLLTEKAIYDWVNTVSGVLDKEHNELSGLQGGAAGEYFHLDGNTYSGISSDGTTMTISQALNVDGDATFDVDVEIAGDTYHGGNVTVTGTFGFDDAGGPYTTVTGIATVMDPTGDDDTLLTEKAIYDWVNTVSGAITSSDTFAGLEDTPSGYSEDEVIYYTSSGTSSSANFTFDPDTNDFAVGASGTARLVIDSDVKSTLYGDSDTFITVSGSGISYTDDGTLALSVTDQGLSLASGARVNDILNVGDGDSIDASSTDTELATAKLIYDTISGSLDLQNEFIELNDTPADYTADGGKLLRVNDTEDAVIFEAGLTYSGGNFVVAGPTTFESNVTAEGDVTVDVDLEVGGDTYFGGNVTVTGTFGFDGEPTISGIVTTITSGSGDGVIPTADAVWDLVSDLDPHTHYELDLTLSGSNVWTVTDASVEGLENANLDVYLNGLLNRDHADYYTASVAGTKLTVTFAYNTYSNDWGHVKFLIVEA